MLRLRKSRERGRTRLDWLDSRHSFSFGDYRDPAFLGFGPLRVINEDVVAPGAGFAPHSHRDMEIVTYVLEGALAHMDSLGSGGVIGPGDIQRMSAGSGITHSEYNAARDKPVHFLQIWIEPSIGAVAPSYERKKIDPALCTNKLARIASPEPLPTELRLLQNAEIWAAKFSGDEEGVHPIQEGRRVWTHVARGRIEVDGLDLETGDGLAVSDEEQLLIRSHGPSEVLLFDMA